MNDVDWNDIYYCLAVAQQGSVTAAAKKLGVSHTTVSRRISTLEKQLGANLFDRSTSGWLVTPVGESVLAVAEQMADNAFSILRQVQADRQELSGKLRVTAVDICIQRLLLPGIKSFAERYPDIDIELIASEQPLNLAAHDADIAFRTTNEPPPNVVGKCIAVFAYQVYGTPELYQRYRDGDPQLGAITWTGDGLSAPDWLPKTFPGMAVRYRSNSLNVVYDLARQGYGFALLPCGLGDPDPELQRIPSSHVEPGMGLWVLSHIDLRTTARIRIFRDHMLESIEPLVPLIEGKMEPEEVLRVKEVMGFM